MKQLLLCCAILVLAAADVSANLENDTCDGAIRLLSMPTSFSVNLCSAVHDYSPSIGGCTGFDALDRDVTYWAALPIGGRIAVCVANTPDTDLSIYLVTDCGDIDGTCVAGSDSGDPECIDYTAVVPNIYYLIVDSYDGCGDVTVTVSELTPTGAASFSAVKARY